MTPQDPSREEARLADLLASVDKTTVPPDEALLARLREQTSIIFEQSKQSDETSKATPALIPFQKGRWRKMMNRYGLPAAAAALIVLGLSYISWKKPSPGPSLAQFIEKIQSLQSFEASVIQDQAKGRLAYVQPAMLRYEMDNDPAYTLVREGQTWQINEADNRATRQPARWFSQGKLELAQLLRLPEGIDFGQLHPLSKVSAGAGQDLYLYDLAGPALQLEVLTSQDTKLPTQLQVVDNRRDQQIKRQIKLINVNGPIAAERFQIKDTLTEDGRVGQVQDIQGIVSVRPVGRDRWTPLAVGDLLKPGDLLRSDPRGPNAARLRLVPNTDVIFGPGSTLEIKTPTEMRVLAGEIEVQPRGRKIQLGSPGAETLTVEEKSLYRVEGEKFTKLAQESAWLMGFKGAVVNESLGSLLANVDGKNVSLNVGYHKVDVDIRDGLARTTIEESFINTTDSELEGTFFFPLPSDASIAGFGMWIGNELVEADVVEKGRAREIFNIILSEKKDPGLLEWAGGNLFKTRVYPIPAHGEKRIKITYTQALPLEGNRFRYNYALLSDLLKQTPLKELSLTINVSSAWPLAKVFSPTHPVREEKTPTAARLVFTAQQHVPTRDFEAVIELASLPPAVTLLPHRRGDDGYFLLRLSPPSGQAGWERDFVRDGPPLHLLILCDTSASIDQTQRQQQSAFVTALLGSLSAKDTFNLGCADVETDWVFPQSQPAESKHIGAAQAMLQARKSMGWTDLEKALASAMKQAGANTHIIYLGDGTPATSLGHDPKVLVDRLKSFVQRGKANVHGVALGSTYEPMVLKAMANLSSGSWRKITAERGPAMQARDLLKEITDPTLVRDLQVKFEGVKVARVYPETLPNVQAGTGLVLAGRYLPTGSSDGKEVKGGTVTIAGVQGQKPVRFSAPFALPAGDEGNSFIPRLWARQHIDWLLENAGVAARDEIIARAEEFHLMTPYTSFLVLENDAMRERFAVKRRFNMRDGEKFFADGRSQAELLLRQRQMLLAADWRIGLQRQALARLGQLGRVLPQPRRWVTERMEEKYNLRLRERSPILADLKNKEVDALELLEGGLVKAPMGGMGGGGFGGGGLEGGYTLASPEAFDRGKFAGRFGGNLGDELGRDMGYGFEGKESLSLGQPRSFSAETGNADPASPDETYLGAKVSTPGAPPVNEPMRSDDFEVLRKERADSSTLQSLERAQLHFASDLSEESRNRRGEMEGLYDLRERAGAVGWEKSAGNFTDLDGSWRTEFSRTGRFAGRGLREYQSPQPAPLGLSQIFPTIALHHTLEVKAKPAKWSPEIIEIVKKLDRRPRLQEFKDAGLVIERFTEAYDLNRSQLASQSRRLELFTPQQWLTRTQSDGNATVVDWCNDKERGSLNLAYQTGRIRKTEPTDRQAPLDLGDWSMNDLAASYGQYEAKLERLGANRVRITLSHEHQHQSIWEIDTARNVLLSYEWRHEKKLSSRTTYNDFQNVAGQWWAGRISTFDEKERLVSQNVQQIQAVGMELFLKRVTEALSQQASCLILPQPLPTLAQAKQAVAPGGKAGVADHIVLMLHFSRSQQWKRVRDHFEQIERVAGDKQATRWIKALLQYAGRDHESLRQFLFREVDVLVKGPRAFHGDEWVLKSFLVNHVSGVATPQESLGFLEKMEPVYRRQPGHLRVMQEYQTQRANWLNASGRGDEALVIYRRLAEGDVFNFSLQWTYFTHLVQIGELDTAQAWLSRLMHLDRSAIKDHEDNFWDHLFRHMFQKGRYRDCFALASSWVKRRPTHHQAQVAYLSALILTDQEAELDQTITSWLRAGPGEENSIRAAQFAAALTCARGQNYLINEYHNRIEERFFAPMVEAAEQVLTSKDRWHFAQEVFSSTAGQSAPGLQLRRRLVTRLHEEVPTLPLNRLSGLVHLALHYASHVGQEERSKQEALWKEISTTLRKRWEQAHEKNDKHQWGNLLSSVLQTRQGNQGYLAFLRERLKAEHSDYRLTHLNAIYNVLQQVEFTPEVESELLSLVTQLDDPARPEPYRLYQQIQRLYPLVDALYAKRQQKLWNAVKEKEKLDRVKLNAKQQEAIKQARLDLAARLAKELDKVGRLAPWVQAEQLYMHTQTGVQLPEVAKQTWSALEAIPFPQEPQEPMKLETQEQAEQERLKIAMELLQESLRERHLSVLVYLATKKTTQAMVADKLLEYLKARLKEQPDHPRWQQHLYQMLIALDRPKEMDALLRSWLLTTGANQRWRIALGYLRAELGDLKEAVELLEKVNAEDELQPAEWRVLSDWYLAIDQKDRHQQAKEEQYQTMPEQWLYQWLNQQHQLVSRNNTGTPANLNEDTFRIIPILFQKSNYPANYIGTVQGLHQTTKDFRLLAGLAEGVIGHTPGRVYPFLQGWNGILGEIREEATVDQLSKHIEIVRKQARTAVDRRALDLLEMLVHRRAAEMINQPGPHAAKAVAALQRAMQHEWVGDEPGEMAEMLAHLGRIATPALEVEQLKALNGLVELAPAGTPLSVRILQNLARTLWHYDRRDAAIKYLQDAVEAVRAKAPGKLLPSFTHPAVTELIGYLCHNRHAEAERFVNTELARIGYGDQAITWLRDQLYSVYQSALTHRARLSIGQNETLLKAMEARCLDDLSKDAPQDRRYQFFQRLCQLYHIGHDLKLEGTQAACRAMIIERFPALLATQHYQRNDLASHAAQTLERVVGVKEALVFLLDEYERAPTLSRRMSYNAWDHFHGYFAQWRGRVSDRDVLDRLLKIVVARLTDELASLRNHRGNEIYYKHHQHFWSNKEETFAATAAGVFANREPSPALARHVAKYLADGLARHGQAIEILVQAEMKNVLNEDARYQMVGYLMHLSRHSEAIPHLLKLISIKPSINYHLKLMGCYYHARQPVELRALLADVEKRFGAGGKWSTGDLARVAQVCVDLELFTDAVRFYEKLIPQYRQEHKNRGLDNGALSKYYQYQARAYVAIGDSVKAVDAASAGIVLWGAAYKDRQDALNALQDVLNRAKDLDNVIAYLDEKAKKDGKEFSLVRRMTAETLMNRQQYGPAITQLKLLTELESSDTKVRALLIACYDQLKQSAQAAEEAYVLAEMTRRNLDYWTNLGDRYRGLNQGSQAERAYTSLIEMLPNEADSHIKLATVRQGTNRWTDAITHWKLAVEYRAEDPAGLFGLAEAQLNQKLWKEADKTISLLEKPAKAWHQRFGNVQGRVKSLRQKLVNESQPQNK